MGRDFAEALNAYLVSSGVPASRFGVVSSNPQKSKHLETATMSLEGFMLDFVNLRSESYTESGGRTPSAMRIGTALEDALRRDLTINSLFYNLSSKAVEDLTGLGVPDLRRRLVRTPLPPLTTLLDDPLRVLRSVRFACRLGFDVDPALEAAAKDPKVKDALGAKVSKERVGDEVDKMLARGSARRAMETLKEYGLGDVVFPDDNDKGGGSLFHKGMQLMVVAQECEERVRNEPWWTPRGKDDDRILWYSAITQPWLQQTPDINSAGKKKKNKHSATIALLKNLRRPNHDVDSILKVQTAASSFSAVSSSPLPLSRYSLALVMREAGGRWRCALLLSLSCALHSAGGGPADASRIRTKYADMAKAIVDMGLVEGYDVKVPLSGEEVKSSVLRNISPGPAFGLVTEAQLQFVLNNPNESIEKLKEFLKKEFPSFV